MKTLLIFFLFISPYTTALGQQVCQVWKIENNHSLDLRKNSICIAISSDNSQKLSFKNEAFGDYTPNNSDTIFIKRINEAELSLSIGNKSIRSAGDGGVVEISSFTGVLSITIIKENVPLPGPVPNIASPSDPDNKINIFNDALALKDPNQQITILKKYPKNTSNIYLKDYYTSADLHSLGSINLFSGIGGIEVTSIADKLASIIVHKVKQELSIAFFADFKTTINDEERYRDFQILFPNTHRKLNQIDDRIYDYKPYLSDLRSNAQSDFKALPFHLIHVLRDSKSQLYRTAVKDSVLYYSLGVSFQLISKLDSCENMGQAIQTISTKDNPFNLNPVKNKPLTLTFDILKLFSFAFKDQSNTDSSYYLPADKIKMLLSDTVLLNNFIGLTLAVSERENFGISSGRQIFDALNKPELKDNLPKFNNLILEFLKVAESHTYARKLDGKEKVSAYFEGVEHLLNAVKLVSEITGIKNTKADNTIDLLRSSCRLLESCYKNEYPSIVVQALNIYDLASKNTNNKIQRKLYKFGTFLAQLINAKNAEDVTDILEYFTSGPGSFRDKKFTTVIAVDSYVSFGRGGFWGKRPDENDFWSVSTPFGISIGTPLNSKLLSSLTVMPTILDLGPLVAFRFSSSDTLTSKIYLKEIISPGIFLSIGLGKPNNPIFINAGFQSYPLLRSVTTSDNTTVFKRIPGWNVGLAVNIPLLTLYNK